MENDPVNILLAERGDCPYWTGHLSSSALATAVAVFALKKVDPEAYADQISDGIRWMAENINEDGGWGDTIRSFSNISTTLLCWSALNDENSPEVLSTVANCEKWIAHYCGSLNPDDIAQAVYQRYDNDRTFSAPIMTVCALSGRLGQGKAAWKHVARLPFELSIFPHSMYSMLGLPVVSYALPALIAIGQVGHRYRPTANPVSWLIRQMAIGKSLKKLTQIQPINGGFLEAVPLTAFVVSSLASKGLAAHEVVHKGVEFIIGSQRADGSFPIDTDLAIWLTTLSVNALSDSGNLDKLDHIQKDDLLNWLVGCQYKETHPYTNSPPGGWGWTDKPGSVPDADDTSGAILALCSLMDSDTELKDSIAITSITNGCIWLLGLQNKDGGIPTFCRGWGKLPFDRSCCDITAHAIAAWSSSLKYLSDDKLKQQINDAIGRALEYLRSQQNYREGFWLPLWFGNQHMPDDSNPVYGTSRVVSGIRYAPQEFRYLVYPMLEKSAQWLAAILCDSEKISSTFNSLEEVALVVHAIEKASEILPMEKEKKTQKLHDAIKQGRTYLTDKQDMPASPIGFYFAKLWYYEELYPLIFQAALKR